MKFIVTLKNGITKNIICNSWVSDAHGISFMDDELEVVVLYVSHDSMQSFEYDGMVEDAELAIA